MPYTFEAFCDCTVRLVEPILIIEIRDPRVHMRLQILNDFILFTPSVHICISNQYNLAFLYR